MELTPIPSTSTADLAGTHITASSSTTSVAALLLEASKSDHALKRAQDRLALLALTNIELDLSGLGITDPVVCELLKTIPTEQLKRVEKISWSANHLGNDGASAFATRLGECTHLKQLMMQRNNVGHDGMVALANALIEHPEIARNIVHLEFGTNNIDSRAIAAFARALPVMSSLEVLYLGRNRIDDDGVCVLAKSLIEANPPLTTFSIDENYLGEQGMETIVHALSSLPKFERAWLGRNYGGDKVAKLVAQWIKKAPHLTVIDIDHTGYTNVGAVALFEATVDLREFSLNNTAKTPDMTKSAWALHVLNELSNASLQHGDIYITDRTGRQLLPVIDAMDHVDFVKWLRTAPAAVIDIFIMSQLTEREHSWQFMTDDVPFKITHRFHELLQCAVTAGRLDVLENPVVRVWIKNGWIDQRLRDLSWWFIPLWIVAMELFQIWRYPLIGPVIKSYLPSPRPSGWGFTMLINDAARLLAIIGLFMAMLFLANADPYSYDFTTSASQWRVVVEIAFIVVVAFDQIKMLMQNRNHNSFLHWRSLSGFRIYTLLQTLLTIALVVDRFIAVGAMAGAPNVALIQADQIFMGFLSLVVWAKLMALFVPFQTTGPFINMIYWMLFDVAKWAVIAVTVLFAFTTSFYVQYHWARESPASAAILSPGVSVISAYDTYQLSLVHQFQAFLGDGVFDDVLSATTVPGQAPFAWTILIYIVYEILATILLLNMLIAMMASTYNKVESRLKAEWLLQLLEYLLDAQQYLGTALPQEVVVDKKKLETYLQDRGHHTTPTPETAQRLTKYKREKNERDLREFLRRQGFGAL